VKWLSVTPRSADVKGIRRGTLCESLVSGLNNERHDPPKCFYGSTMGVELYFQQHRPSDWSEATQIDFCDLSMQFPWTIAQMELKRCEG
jgi:hypothetical protein